MFFFNCFEGRTQQKATKSQLQENEAYAFIRCELINKFLSSEKRIKDCL